MTTETGQLSGGSPGQSSLVSVQVGLPTRLGTPGAVDRQDRPWTTGFFKHAVAGPVWLGRTNLAGDGQADRRFHGGPDRAVLAYAAAHYPIWRVELGRPDFPEGAFGENFTVDGLDEGSVCLGDTFAVGEALIQVSQPRQPCWKVARRWRMRGLPARVQRTGRTGWYLRVLREGFVAPGLALVLLERPCPEWTVTRATETMRRRIHEPDAATALAACPFLSASWRRALAAHCE